MNQLEIIEAHVEASKRLARLLTIVQQLHADALPAWFKRPEDDLFGQADIEERFHDPSYAYLLARYDGHDAGFALYQEMKRPDNPYTYNLHHFIIDQICVHPDYRRRGIARALVHQIRQIAQEAGATGIQLSIWAFNEGSQAFFLSEGFAPIQARYYQEIS